MSKKQALSQEYIVDSDSDIEQEPVEFEPPRHFHQVKPSSSSSTSTGLNKDIKSKEVWLFKLPKSLDMKDVNELEISAQTMGTVFKHKNGRSYRITQELFAQDNSNTEKYSVLIPTKGKYHINKDAKIKRIFTISETVTIPTIDLSKVRIERNDVPKEEELRMRHFPTGYGANDYEEAKKTAATTTTTNTTIAHKKRKHEREGEEEEGKSKTKKDKKEHKKDKKSKKDKK